MTQKSNVKIALRQIANTILLNAGKINGSGLFSGKMGIALLFYHYARIDNDKVYNDFADELLDGVINSLNESMPVNFADGLTGIAWAINYLINNKFIEAESDILEDVDIVLNNNHSNVFNDDISSGCCFFSKGTYFISRNYCFDRMEYIWGEMKNALNQSSKAFPLSYLNSMMYVILQANMKLSTDLSSVLYEKMICSIKNKNYTFPEAWMLKNMIEQFYPEQNLISGVKWYELLNMLDYENISGIFNQGIYDLIFEGIKVDYNLIINRFGSMDMGQHIENRIKDVYRNLNLYDGLSGVGLTLINCLKSSGKN